MIDPKNLLIVRTDRIGDVVLSLPLSGIIKKHFPDCKVTFLLKEYTLPLAVNHPSIDNIITLKEENGRVPVKKNVDILKEFNFDSAIVVYPTFQTSLIIYLSKIKNRIGTGYRWYSFLFNQKIYEHRKYAKKHELEYNVNLLKKFGIEENVNPENVEFNIKIDEKISDQIKDFLKSQNINKSKPIIVVHPGSGGSAVDLPVEKYKELVKHMSKNLDSRILITGSPSEKKLCEKLVVNSDIINLAGKFNLEELIALINQSDIFISNSTGPIHIAAALGKYTVGFYPNLRACSAKRWGPYTEKKVIFTPKPECDDCKREQCSSLECMNSIQVTDIFAEVHKIYNIVQNNGENNAA